MRRPPLAVLDFSRVHGVDFADDHVRRGGLQLLGRHVDFLGGERKQAGHDEDDGQ
jgi:hypothetical protein